MRYTMTMLAAMLLVVTVHGGCASRAGPGDNCGCDTIDDALPTDMPPGSAAAAAVAGQRAANAPWVEDKGVSRFKTTVGRGAGDTNSESSDFESRAVSSGGAQNLALMNPAVAQADSAGGVAPAVQEAAKTVEAYRTALRVASLDPSVPDSRLQFLADGLTKAQEALAAASASSRANVTHHYEMSGDNTIIGYSRAGNGEGPDNPEALKALGAGAQTALGAKKSSPASPAGSQPVAPEGEESPENPSGDGEDGE